MATSLMFSWVFLLTLQSYYSYSLNLALPPLVAAVGSLVVLPWFLLRGISEEFILSARKILYFWGYLLVVGAVLSFFSDGVYLTRIVAMPLYLAVGMMTVYLLVYDRVRMRSVVHMVILVHVTFFIIQAFAFYLGFGFIDYLMPFTGEEQRAFGGSYRLDRMGVGELIRPTGLHNEPGTYSNIVFLLFVIYKNILDDSGQRARLNYFDIIVLLTIIASFSIFGFVYVSLYLLYISIKSFKGLVAILIAVVLIFPVIYEVYLYPRFFSGDYDDTGLEFRYSAIGDYIGYLLDGNLFGLMFGLGLFTDLSSILGDFVWNDLGLLFYLFVTIGFFGVVIFFYACYRGIVSNRALLAFVVLLMTKLSLSALIFWFMFAVLVHVNTRRIAHR